MGLRLICDWCAEEPSVKLRLPEQRVILPKGWKFELLENDSHEGEGEVVVSCGKRCRNLISEVHGNIKDARAEKNTQEERKRKKRLGY